MSEVGDFLKKQTIFFTGLTGFVGKVLLWKMLNEGGDGIKIYALVRSNKDGSPQKRVADVFATRIFDELLSSRPHLKDCVIPLEGDITKDEFGLSEENLRILEKEVTVIIHSAATTKFTENLKTAVDMNVLGVRRMLALAKRCQKLCSVVHISTCYVAADKPEQSPIEERIYLMSTNPFEIISLLDKMTLEEADRKTPEIIGRYPNTYSFTKAIGEHLIMAEKGNLPICFLRPSIVTSALEEPLPGWIDVMLGPAGLFLSTGMGALHVMQGNPNCIADFVPVDLVCNAILSAAWRNTQLSAKGHDWTGTPPIYQLATSTLNPLTWHFPRHMIAPYFRRHPPKRGFGYPEAFWIQNGILFRICHWTFHLLPAFLLDFSRLIQGRKMFMIKATQRLNKAIRSLVYFTSNSWTFEVENTRQMQSELNERDRKIFNIDVGNFDWDIYFELMCHGLRKFMLKEEDPPKPQDRLKALNPPTTSSTGGLRSYLMLLSFGVLLLWLRPLRWALALRSFLRRRFMNSRRLLQ